MTYKCTCDYKDMYKCSCFDVIKPKTTEEKIQLCEAQLTKFGRLKQGIKEGKIFWYTLENVKSYETLYEEVLLDLLEEVA